jgi:hypothetical protein
MVDGTLILRKLGESDEYYCEKLILRRIECEIFYS